MGRTPVPLVIWIPVAWRDRPEVQALREKGHTVAVIEAGDPDLILSPAAHQWQDEWWEKKAYLEAALKAARARAKDRAPKEPKKVRKSGRKKDAVVPGTDGGAIPGPVPAEAT